jgi:hypothetical protein
LVTALPAGLGVLATIGAWLWPVYVGGIGTLTANAVGLRIEVGAFVLALMLSIGLAWIDGRPSIDPRSQNATPDTALGEPQRRP